MFRTFAVNQIRFLHKRFVANTIPTFVRTLVHVAGRFYPFQEFDYGRLMSRFGCANEVVETDTELFES